MEKGGYFNLTPEVMRELIELYTIEDIVERSRQLGCPVSEDTAFRILFMGDKDYNLQQNPPSVLPIDFEMGEAEYGYTETERD